MPQMWEGSPVKCRELRLRQVAGPGVGGEPGCPPKVRDELLRLASPF